MELTNGHQIEISDSRTQKNRFKKEIEKFSEGIKKWEPKRLGQLLSYRPPILPYCMFPSVLNMLDLRLGHLCEWMGDPPTLLGQCPKFDQIFVMASLSC